MVSQGYKLKEIAGILKVSPSTVSRELKDKRIETSKAKTNEKCKKLDRFPYVCNACSYRYGNGCPFARYTYKAREADLKARELLVNGRKGIDMEREYFKILDKLIKEGVERKESIYHIVHSNPEIKVSVPTVYRYIDQGILKTKRMDLPYAVTYKKRNNKKKYDYSKSNKSIDRNNRTYLDFLAYKRSHTHEYNCQLDFLGSVRTDRKSILTLTIPDLHFVILELIEDPTSLKVSNLFNKWETLLGKDKFKEIFPFILTDRDPCFSNYELLETNPDTGEIRTHLFYCDPYVSSQKGNVENMNKQLRKYFPKGKSISKVTPGFVKEVAYIINNSKIRSLSGYTPYEAFIKVYGQDALDKLTK